MFILADKFVGNLIESKYSYLKDRKLYYTNDGINFKKQLISRKDIFDKELSSFFSYLTIYNWIPQHILEQIKDLIDYSAAEEGIIGRLFVNVFISPDNKLIDLEAVEKASISEKIFAPMENIIPSSVSTIYSDNLTNGFFTHTIPSPDDGLTYHASFCTPNIKKHQKYGIYSFDYFTIGIYSSTKPVYAQQ